MNINTSQLQFTPQTIKHLLSHTIFATIIWELTFLNDISLTLSIFRSFIHDTLSKIKQAL